MSGVLVFGLDLTYWLRLRFAQAPRAIFGDGTGESLRTFRRFISTEHHVLGNFDELFGVDWLREKTHVTLRVASGRTAKTAKVVAPADFVGAAEAVRVQRRDDNLFAENAWAYVHVPAAALTPRLENL